ncbi:hypothetical protein AB6A40_004302 [Gnathostoma spinigerum]|uniref:Uncharacterized protein n=1 Tax=Gnathostoma spinigerum TaxID=75299 RepID=A0ABD6EKV4_9BILA
MNALLLTFVITSLPLISGFLDQSVGVKGQLLCGNEPLAGTKVKLINHNMIAFDNDLGHTLTDENGYYEVSGRHDAVFDLDVRLKIYTSCNKGISLCDREITLGIPSDFVTRSDGVEKWFNGGKLNMQFKFKDEGSKCL